MGKKKTTTWLSERSPYQAKSLNSTPAERVTAWKRECAERRDAGKKDTRR